MVARLAMICLPVDSERFRPKLDWRYIAPYCLALLLGVALILRDRPGVEDRAMFLLMIVVSALVAVQRLRRAEYRIEGRELVIRTYRWYPTRVPIDSIDTVTVSRAFLEGPGFKAEHLRLHYWKDGGGEDIRVAPVDAEAFIAALQKVNPAIRVERMTEARTGPPV